MTTLLDGLMIPPKRVRELKGAFSWPERPVLLTARTTDDLPLSQLARDLRRVLRLKPRFAYGTVSPSSVRIVRNVAVRGTDAFRMSIKPDCVEISASSDAGAYYAVQLLRDLVRLHGKSIPACEIRDDADFRRRAVYLDCSRGRVPRIETLKDLVERLASWRVNELQLYIENVFVFHRHPDIGRGFSPFTPKDILDLQEHCKLHHIRLVPSIASFGHLETVLCLPRYRHLAELPGTHGRSGGTTLCPTDPGSIRLIRDMYEEFVPLFEADDFNICGDETWELGKGRSKPKADRVGMPRVYIDFVKQIHQLVEKHGKRMNMWADVVLQHPEHLDLVPRDIVMLNWDYAAQGRRFKFCKNIAAAGFPLIVCPGTSGWQTHGTRLDNAIQNVANFVKLGRRHGAEGVLNTDWGDSGHRNMIGVSLHGLAHGAAHAWNGKRVDDEKFTERFCARVFGEKTGKLAAALRALGASTEQAETQLYHALVEPIVANRSTYFRGIQDISPVRMGNAGKRDDMGKASAKGLRRVVSDLSQSGLWPSLPGDLDSCEKAAVNEMQLAARMDVLAAQRSLLGRRVRAGDSVPSGELRSLATEMQRMVRDFEKLWLTRNKPSRLNDNLKLMTRAGDELSALAKR